MESHLHFILLNQQHYLRFYERGPKSGHITQAVWYVKPFVRHLPMYMCGWECLWFYCSNWRRNEFPVPSPFPVNERRALCICVWRRDLLVNCAGGVEGRGIRSVPATLRPRVQPEFTLRLCRIHGSQRTPSDPSTLPGSTFATNHHIRAFSKDRFNISTYQQVNTMTPS